MQPMPEPETAQARGTTMRLQASVMNLIQAPAMH